jgi:glutaredoxin 3
MSAKDQPVVEVYSAWNCPYCVRAKRLLRSKGVRFRQYQVWLLFVWILPTARFKEMAARSGRDSVPQIFVGGKHLGGCDDLTELERRGELDALLGSE